jgi:hypothetical protein
MNTQFSIPDAGCQIAITFEFPSYVIGTAKVNKTTITGIVEKATKFTPPNFVRIVTDFDSPVRIREIPLHRITNLEYADGRIAIQETIKEDTETWSVDGSKGSKYTVVRTRNKWTCTCPGFQFRKSCRHIQELQNA